MEPVGWRFTTVHAALAVDAATAASAATARL
jgi:hypothetical protein